MSQNRQARRSAPQTWHGWLELAILPPPIHESALPSRPWLTISEEAAE